MSFRESCKPVSIFKNVLQAFSQFVYPSFCLHCGCPINGQPFCSTCLGQLEPIELEERCPYCFSSDYQPEKRVCYPCFMDRPLLKRRAAVFEYQGVAATLLLKMKYGNQPYLAKGAGAFLAMQFLRLEWPFPDLIVPVPLTLVHRISRGYNQSFLLAEALGTFLNRPTKKILSRRWLDQSQARMSKEQRLDLEAEAFSLNKKIDIQDKVILLVDDVITTGRTMQCCAENLSQGFPKAIYGISLCMS